MDKIRALVSDELNMIEERFSNLFEIKNNAFRDLNDFLLGKSKRIRSLICLLYLKSFGKIVQKEIMDVLFSTELIHNASLLHDDVVDNSTIRRGVPNIYYKHGPKISVLTGDYILSIAVEKLLGVNNPAVMHLFLDATKRMSEAEIIQFEGRSGNVSIERYLEIVNGKTASLFRACIKSAALISGLEVSLAERFADNFGIIFQINNDLSPESVENDKNNGTATAIDIIGIEKTLDLKDNYKKELSKVLINIPENCYKKGIEDLIELL